MKTQQQSPIVPLIELSHRRWNIPVIAEIERRSGAKYITLANSLGASRSSLSASLEHLIELGLVRRNPGYGHPMRPEYLLTEDGERIGGHCLRLANLFTRRDEADLAYRKWTLPLVAGIGGSVRRFSELRAALGEQATARAVTLALKTLLSADWAERSLIDDYPPTAGYALMPKGRKVLTIVGSL